MRRSFSVAVGLLFGAGVAVAGEAELARVTVNSPHVKVGEAAQVKVTFQVAEGSHISPDAPLKLEFKGPPGVRIERPTLRYKDGAASGGGGPVFQDAVTPLAAGTHDVEIDASYYVCTAELCNRQTKTLHAKVVAK